MMSVPELLSRAKRAIESGETSLRAAAEDIAAAQEQGATQRQIAEAVGKSAAWVNQLLKWRHSSYRDVTPFGPQAKASRQRANRVQSPEQNDQKPASTSGQARAAERRQQKDDQRTALQNICRQLEREGRSASSAIWTCAAAWARSPNRFRRRCHQRTNRHSPSPKILSERFDVLLMARGFDPAGPKKAIADFVDTVLAPQQ